MIHLAFCTSHRHVAVNLIVSLKITRRNQIKLGRNITWNVLNIIYDFRFIQKFNMATSPIVLSDWLNFFYIFLQITCVM